MQQILTFDEKNFMINGKPVYLNCGEFHYFRVPKQDWKRRMQLLKNAGGNAVATYIPWLIHEPEEGKFLFDQGDGITDLSDFLECAKEVGLFVIARPGPYAYSELVNGGLPDWLLKNHPEIKAVKRHGGNHGYSNVSYLHPVFLEKVKKFYEVVCPIIAKYTQNNGGTVAVVQVDNELTGVHVWFGGYDFNPETMGFGKEGGRYPEYLKEKYGTVEKVNAFYGTDKKAFTEFFPADEPESGLAHLRWNSDYIDFYNRTITEYISILMDWAEEGGIDCPFCHNAANPWMNPVFRHAKKKFGNKLLIGSDHYYMLNQCFEQNNPTPAYMIYDFMSAEMLRLMKNPPCIFETQYGSIADWPPTTEEDVEALLMCQLASGVRGHNGYVYTGGPNPPGCGTTCTIYDYNAPVAADGTCRPTYDALRRFGSFVERHGELATDTAAVDVRVVFPWKCFSGVSGTVDEKRAPEIGSLANCFQKGLLSCLFAANLQPEMVDHDDLEWMKDTSSPVFVTCDGTMDADIQQKYVDYIKAGGNVIFNPVIPFMDEDYQPCTILSDAFGGANSGEKITVPCGRLDFHWKNEVANVFFGALFGKDAVIPADAKRLGSEVGSGDCLGYYLPVAGGGSLSWCGVQTVLVRTAHIEMYRTMFEAAGGKALWRTDNNWVLQFRRKTEKGTLVFLANLGTSKQRVNAQFRADAQSNWKTLPEITLNAMEIKTVMI